MPGRDPGPGGLSAPSRHCYQRRAALSAPPPGPAAAACAGSRIPLAATVRNFQGRVRVRAVGAHGQLRRRTTMSRAASTRRQALFARSRGLRAGFGRYWAVLSVHASVMRHNQATKVQSPSLGLQKSERNSFGPWPSLPSAVLLGGPGGPEPALGFSKKVWRHLGVGPCASAVGVASRSLSDRARAF
jgi:hypothetical protein